MKENYTSEHVWLTEEAMRLIPVREWGLPTGVTPGKRWRSAKNMTMSIMVDHPTDPKLVKIETKKILIMDRVIIPRHWSLASAEYDGWFINE